MLQLLLVVLFEQSGDDEAYDRGLVGNDAADVGAAFDLLVQSFDGIWRMRFRQKCPADTFLERAEAILA